MATVNGELAHLAVDLRNRGSWSITPARLAGLLIRLVYIYATALE